MKEEIRRKYLQKRKALTAAELEVTNSKIQKRLVAEFPWLQEKIVHVFLPITKQKEIDTWPIVKWLWSGTGEVAVSKSSLEHNEMLHYRFLPETKIDENKWGIPEPIQANPVDIKSIETVLIPMVIFDTAGHRVGYGKGYYDRFLADCRADVNKIGLCHFGPLDEFIPLNAVDISMNYCVTPERTFKFEL